MLLHLYEVKLLGTDVSKQLRLSRAITPLRVLAVGMHHILLLACKWSSVRGVRSVRISVTLQLGAETPGDLKFK